MSAPAATKPPRRAAEILRRGPAAILQLRKAPAGELDAKTDWLVQRLVTKSPTALRRGKAMMRAAFDMTFEQSISFLETQIMTLALTEDAKEGRASFVEKRAPR